MRKNLHNEDLNENLNLDLHRTERPAISKFYWVEDTFIHEGYRRSNMRLSTLPRSIKESFKQNLLAFTQTGNYAPTSYGSLIGALTSIFNNNPPQEFDLNWAAHASRNRAIKNCKRIAIEFLLFWNNNDSLTMGKDVVNLFNDTIPSTPRSHNVLSDDPDKSWISDEDYEILLRATWNNYDNGVSSTQVTLIKLLSMQYARRPIQIAHLKIGDIENIKHKGCTINFPGAKDVNAKTNFRDSKFESHPLGDHLWELCQLQITEAKELYEHLLQTSLNDDQLSKLPLFCSEPKFIEARKIIENGGSTIEENLDNEYIHLSKFTITQIARWDRNTPSCKWGEEAKLKSFSPNSPVSAETGKPMVVNATRMRHTRARQLARKGVPPDILSHWLGHTSPNSLKDYYNDPAERARIIDEAMELQLIPIAMAFTGKLIETESESSRSNDPSSRLEFAHSGKLKSVGCCGKESFCSTTSIPVPCYRCKNFEPLVDAPHDEVLRALYARQTAEKEALQIGGPRLLLFPIDLSADIRAVENCIARCKSHKAELVKHRGQAS